ncbi:hypothetical protein [Zunongwangia atlantica]|uniref:Uncharacterized protein n=1 Tax=Zunongwangia atlantica 22II14-10F7 TaxID=1185767 RepID=A0A1Y1T155_9FLAO|nr:hypothetical protein [Zunongwangia atlantica]ORL44759.1 hypothetical protein IIF7_14644 [Zunongwangia atlantica 22II14-10F7]
MRYLFYIFLAWALNVSFKSGKGARGSGGNSEWNDAHHAVLWTKDSFSGDVKIEFDYTKTDHENRFVNILYIQATGHGKGVHERDISEWKKKREVPAMREYFENMNVFLISYAAFGNSGDGTHYIRARRYPKLDEKPFKQTLIEPSYDDQGLFETGKTYHITAIKNKEQLYFKMESKGDQSTFTWDIQKVEPIEQGRIGILLMYTRSAFYKNIKIYTKE